MKTHILLMAAILFMASQIYAQTVIVNSTCSNSNVSSTTKTKGIMHKIFGRRKNSIINVSGSGNIVINNSRGGRLAINNRESNNVKVYYTGSDSVNVVKDANGNVVVTTSGNADKACGSVVINGEQINAVRKKGNSRWGRKIKVRGSGNATGSGSIVVNNGGGNVTVNQ